MQTLVRLKPFNGKAYVLRTYTVRSKKFVGGERPAWYSVSEELAKYLRTVHQRPGDEDTPLAFDVCTEAEARAIDAKENAKSAGTVAAPIDAAEPKRVHNVTHAQAAKAAGTVTTADLPKLSTPEPSDEFTDDMTEDPSADSGDKPASAPSPEPRTAAQNMKPKGRRR